MPFLHDFVEEISALASALGLLRLREPEGPEGKSNLIGSNVWINARSLQVSLKTQNEKLLVSVRYNMFSEWFERIRILGQQFRHLSYEIFF